MSREDEQLDAAEYVIGTLSGAERAAFEIMSEADPNVRSDVAFWERIFGKLNASVSPVIPSQNVWESISTQIGGDAGSSDAATGIAVGAAATTFGVAATAAVADAVKPDQPTLAPGTVKPETKAAAPAATIAANDNVAKLKRSRSRWRWGAIAASIAALGLGALVYDSSLRDTLVAKYLPGSISDGGKSYIAVVNTPDQPAMIVKVNSKTGEVSVRSIRVNRPEGKSYELWYVPEGQKPISVGLVGEGKINLGNTPAKDGDLLAISVEPSGGSPTGVATGPVIYTGKLIEDVDAQ